MLQREISKEQRRPIEPDVSWPRSSERRPVRWGCTTGWAAPSLSRPPSPIQPGADPDSFDVEDLLFTLTSSSHAVTGTPVRIKPGAPPSVHIDSGRNIGEINHRARALLMVRFEDGYLVAGHIVDLDSRRETGTLRVCYLRHPALLNLPMSSPNSLKPHKRPRGATATAPQFSRPAAGGSSG